MIVATIYRTSRTDCSSISISESHIGELLKGHLDDGSIRITHQSHPRVDFEETRPTPFSSSADYFCPTHFYTHITLDRRVKGRECSTVVVSVWLYYPHNIPWTGDILPCHSNRLFGTDGLQYAARTEEEGKQRSEETIDGYNMLLSSRSNATHPYISLSSTVLRVMNAVCLAVVSTASLMLVLCLTVT
jgi:hypothetical protein